MDWTYAFLNMCELESFHESYSSGILLDKISTLQLLRKWEVNERLCIGEVGVDLELCVHAHGNDVELIMIASRNNNYSLGIIWSCIYGFVLCNRGSDRDCSSLIPFSDKLKVLAFCRSLRLSNLYFDRPSGITPWYLEDINPLHYILWISDEVVPFPIIATPRVLGCRQPRTPICELNQHCDSVLPVLCCWEV